MPGMVVSVILPSENFTETTLFLQCILNAPDKCTRGIPKSISHFFLVLYMDKRMLACAIEQRGVLPTKGVLAEFACREASSSLLCLLSPMSLADTQLLQAKSMDASPSLPPAGHLPQPNPAAHCHHTPVLQM